MPHRPGSLNSASLGEALTIEERQPEKLTAAFRAWHGSRTSLGEVAPTLAVAVLGQGRASANWRPRTSPRTVANVLTYWALRSTLDIAELAPRPCPRHPGAGAPNPECKPYKKEDEMDGKPDLAIEFDPKQTGPGEVGTQYRIVASGVSDDYTFAWKCYRADGDVAGEFEYDPGDHAKKVAYMTPTKPGVLRISCVATLHKQRKVVDEQTEEISLSVRRAVPVTIVGEPFHGPVDVSLQRAEIEGGPDSLLWSLIRRSTEGVAFNNFQDWMDSLFSGDQQDVRDMFGGLIRSSAPFPGIVSYKALKLATEAFLLANVGVAFGDVETKGVKSENFDRLVGKEERKRLGLGAHERLNRLWTHDYLERVRANSEYIETLPYLALVRRNLPEWRVELNADANEQIELCDAILARKFSRPTFVELLWSYWHEEGMLVRSVQAIATRFQNRGSGPRDPLAGLALDPLRPLNNLLWGYIQDEQHRLTLTRRVYEYDHEYGLTLFGRAAPRLGSADPRSQFLEAFHTLLHRTAVFHKDDDDATMLADPFPVLNALRDVHLLLAEGAHNAYGDLPWTARHEMLMQQYLLARPELREFLPTRVAIAYPEEWMHRVDAMKNLQGWSDTSVRYFRDLGVFGEQLLLSIRFGNWSNVIDPERAGNWARAWRQEVQWYIHAYQSVTGIDLSADTTDVRQAQLPPDR
jgi:hypothetical protein